MMTKRILLRCDGGAIPELGTGHIVRCLTLAAELQRGPGVELAFLMRDIPEGVKRVRDRGFPVMLLPADGDEAYGTLKAITEFKPDIVVMDKLETPAETMALVKNSGVITVALDDAGPGADHADITINSLLPNGKGMYEGFAYLVMPESKAARGAARRASAKPRVLVSFGGYDHSDLTARFMAQARALDGDFEYQVVVSELYDMSRLEPVVAGMANVSVHRAPADFVGLLTASDAAVVSGGLTMFQAAAHGVPSLVVGQYPHQVRNAERLAREGAAESLGLGDSLDLSGAVRRLQALLAEAPRRESMSDRGRRLIPGQGNRSVAALIGIIDRLDWDSRFFGKNIAYLRPNRLRESIVRFALRKCREADIDCLYYLCDCHDPESVRIAESYGFHFVDIRLTFRRHVPRQLPSARPPEGLTVRLSRPGDDAELTTIAQESYVQSRYYFDRHFPTELCRRFYTDWIVKSSRGEFDDAVFVAEKEGRVAGFVSVKAATANLGKIGLTGVARDFQGQGVGRALIGRAMEWYRERDLPMAEVVTQGRNIAAQRLYQSCGFTSEQTQLWYHKWFAKDYRIEGKKA